METYLPSYCPEKFGGHAVRWLHKPTFVPFSKHVKYAKYQCKISGFHGGDFEEW
jgi:hypothetical protein